MDVVEDTKQGASKTAHDASGAAEQGAQFAGDTTRQGVVSPCMHQDHFALTSMSIGCDGERSARKEGKRRRDRTGRERYS